MAQKILREDVLKLAKLANLSLSEEEIEQYQRELSAIFAYMGKLDELDLSGLEPTSQITGLENVTREDVVKMQLASPEELLKNLPDREDDYIKVKRMIG